MIKKFDIRGAVALYKREFCECVESSDYDGAIDKLIKFSEATENPDFHLAMGMLYVLMTQNCDDQELLTLAYREFMMHLAFYPDCKRAYSALLAVAFLRRDAASIVEFCEWTKKCGFDVAAMVDELSMFGIDIFTEDGAFIDFDGLFPMRAFGAIADGYCEPLDDEERAAESAPPKKEHRGVIIKFKGGKFSDVAATIEGTPAKNKVLPFNRTADPEPPYDANALFDVMMQIAKSDDEDDERDTDVAFGEVDDEEVGDEDLRYKLALREAQRLCSDGDYDAALLKLDAIGPESERLYYCAECIRANIYMDRDNLVEAQAALDRAYTVRPDGALVGTIRCALYELKKDYEQIPATLERIDVGDFVDSDHVFKALSYAIKYCNPSQALSLAEQYVEEFNSLDLRKVYAQMLYNTGDRKQAVKELFTISRVLYDDFNAQYFYILAKSDIDRMPVEEETPQNVLGLLVDGIIDIIRSKQFTANDDIITSEPFRFGLEVFLTLEYKNTRSVIKIMFETLRTISADARLRVQMRNALCSPYVEPLVKAVILSALMCESDGAATFIMDNAFCPLSNVSVPQMPSGYGNGYYTAYAFLTVFNRRALPYMFACSATLKAALDKTGYKPDDRDIAYYLWMFAAAEGTFKDKEVAGRIEYALGFDSKTQAQAAYKKLVETVRACMLNNNRE